MIIHNMNYIWAAASTDAGRKKKINQDALLLKIANSHCGKIAFAAVCDGMGGLQQGEVASGILSQDYEKWFRYELPILLKEGLTRDSFQNSLNLVTERTDTIIKQYASRQQIQMGSTATVLLIVRDRYFIFHIGDTRIYKVTSSKIEQLTTDHTYVQQQVQQGFMSEQEAKVCNNRNVLLQCVGASARFQADVIEGRIYEPSSFILCSDGFRHKINNEELFEQLSPFNIVSEDDLQRRLQRMIEWNKERGEVDNISAISIKIF